MERCSIREFCEYSQSRCAPPTTTKSWCACIGFTSFQSRIRPRELWGSGAAAHSARRAARAPPRRCRAPRTPCRGAGRDPPSS
eukprot:gene13230-biopygen20014